MTEKYSDRPIPATLLIATVFAAALAVPLASSCARKSQAQTKAVQQAGEVFSAVASGIPSASNHGRPTPAQPAADAAKRVPPLAAGLRAFSLGARPDPRMPEDFSLGPLQSSRPDSKEKAAALETARTFLAGAAAGKVDPSIYLPEARDALSALLAPAPAKEGAAALPGRIGAIEMEGDAASMGIRLPSSPGDARIEGLLSLRKRDGAWYVESLALDPPSSGELAFAPGARPPSP
jgi:hypothetical protein